MDYAAHIAAEEEHCRAMARVPGAQAYVKAKAQRLAKEHPSMYGNLPRIVAAEIEATNAAQPQENH